MGSEPSTPISAFAPAWFVTCGGVDGVDAVDGVDGDGPGDGAG